MNDDAAKIRDLIEERDEALVSKAILRADLTRTIAALREVLSEADMALSTSGWSLQAMLRLRIRTLLASPDVTGPSEAWVSREEHGRKCVELGDRWASKEQEAHDRADAAEKREAVLREACTSAQRELHLLRTKDDCGVYDPTVRTLLEAALVDTQPTGWVREAELNGALSRIAALEGAISVELHCGRFALMIGPHGVVIETDKNRSDQMPSGAWGKEGLDQIVADFRSAGKEQPEPDRWVRVSEVERVMRPVLDGVVVHEQGTAATNLARAFLDGLVGK